ncbi:hypothetical protein CNMCM5623_004812 [Aspergillus felis]|uniref:Leucine-rich repeat domain-containing protein n=1 Tax=Aspergillus felis TaxID=1287682 RepID=A0A8H6PSE4_9EURO|nr:hypothetical protein CNMCM5623_004812 [Aspergillus felis]
MNKIPVDICLHIGQFCTRHDLFQLVLVSKSFYALFIPQLYNHVRLPLTRYDESIHCWYTTPPLNDLPVRRFTQAIIENPSLAILIHSLDLYPDTLEGAKWRGRPPLNELPEERFKASLFPYGTSKRKYWRKYQAWRNDLRDRPSQKPERLTEDAWLGLLLLQLRNLQRLTIWLTEERSIYEPHWRLTVYLDRVIHWARDPKLGILTRLTHLYVRDGPVNQGEGGEEAIPLDRIMPYLRIPSLRNLHVVNLSERPGRALLEKDLPLTHINVQGIHFHRGIYSSGESVPKLLSMCSRLQSFTWRSGLTDIDHAYPSTHDFMNPCSLYAPLRRSRETLRELSIALEGRPGDEDTQQNVQLPRPRFLGSLSDFPVLETINMRLSNLMHFHERTHVPITHLWEVLPRSLRILYIRDCLVQSSSMLCHELEALAARVSPGFPRLQTLGIQFAFQELEPGLGCWSCVGHQPKAIVETDCVIDDGIELLKGKFRELNVNFQVMPRGQALPFSSLEHYFCFIKHNHLQ